MRNHRSDPHRWSNKEWDTTILVLGGVLIALLMVGCLFYFDRERKDLLTPGIVMALINMPSILISFGMGKKTGETNGHHTIAQHEQTIQHLTEQLDAARQPNKLNGLKKETSP